MTEKAKTEDSSHRTIAENFLSHFCLKSQKHKRAYLKNTHTRTHNCLQSYLTTYCISTLKNYEGHWLRNLFAGCEHAYSFLVTLRIVNRERLEACRNFSKCQLRPEMQIPPKCQQKTPQVKLNWLLEAQTLPYAPYLCARHFIDRAVNWRGTDQAFPGRYVCMVFL